jgi:hypothetical protein
MLGPLSQHDALMARRGHYSMLYDTYFRHQSADFNSELLRETKEARAA